MIPLLSALLEDREGQEKEEKKSLNTKHQRCDAFIRRWGYFHAAVTVLTQVSSIKSAYMSFSVIERLLLGVSFPLLSACHV